MPQEFDRKSSEKEPSDWIPGNTPVAVIMITLNEAHNMEDALRNLKGWAQEVFIVDSYSSDETVDIALAHGAYVVQRPFRGFGDQWNFALEELPITAPWTMKMDPDERLGEKLKANIEAALKNEESIGITFHRRLWFLGEALPVIEEITRIWKTGYCKFSNVSVNEHPLVAGTVRHVAGEMQHHDSPDLEHWINKQNKYTTAEAIAAFKGDGMAEVPRLLGNALQRRMWVKKHFYKIPLRYFLFFLYNWICRGAWKSGRAGYIWSRLRSDVMRLIEYKNTEMVISGRISLAHEHNIGQPDPRVKQYE